MSKKCYYAVKEGRKTGIFDSWFDCQKQVNRYKKAVYKGFATRHEDILWLNQTKPNNNPYENVKKRKAYAYVDGSYNDKTGNYGYASILHYDGEVSYDMGLGQDKSRNLAGEFLAAMAAIRKAMLLGVEELTIYYDYAGIENVATGKQHKIKTAIGKEYQRYINAVKSEIALNFIHTPSHTGIYGNEEVDKLAKRSAQLSSFAASEIV